MFEQFAFWPRIRRDNSSVVEQALADPSLFDQEALAMSGAVVEAAHAQNSPAILGRLSQLGIPFIVDPAAWRFLSAAYSEMPSWSKIPYAPADPITPDSQVGGFVEQCLSFQETTGASALVTPGTKWSEPQGEWSDLNLRIHETAQRLSSDKPKIAYCAPSWPALRRPEEVIKPLADLGFKHLYLQPTNFRPTADSVEKLAAYTEFVVEASHAGIDVVAARVGSFGLILNAVKVKAFDSGLGDAEGFDLASSLRAKKKSSKGGGGGGGNRRVYVRELKTTLMDQEASAIFAEEGVSSRFVCNLPCCRFQGWENIGDRRRDHNLRVRLAEVEAMNNIPSPAWRLQQLRNELEVAQSNALVVQRVLASKSTRLPKFDHLGVWLSVINRIQESASAA